MRRYFPLAILSAYLVIVLLVVAWSRVEPALGTGALIAGNTLLALIALVTFFIVRRRITRRPQAFVQGVYGATLLKLFLCIAAVLVYVLLNRADLHKPSLFSFFGMYAVYTVIETWMLSKEARQLK